MFLEFHAFLTSFIFLWKCILGLTGIVYYFIAEDSNMRWYPLEVYSFLLVFGGILDWMVALESARIITLFNLVRLYVRFVSATLISPSKIEL